MKLPDLLLLALGGVLGTWARFGMTGLNRPAFPGGTLLVNVVGCLVMGAVLRGIETGMVKSEWRLFLGIGFLGAFTTFSTFSAETLALLHKGSINTALLYIGLTVAGCLLMVALGYRAALVFWR
ncbi:MAG TPA: fluoride efflux transporter CrcB [Armatimonadota bacterium]|nr:fluoride efflux transporter CrcB [Armatimonadota bacterium]